MKYLAILFSTFFFAQFSYAGVCEISYKRTSCAGKEKISYKKCGGKQSCVKKKRAKNMEKCQELALRACSNSRLEITKHKVITAKFDGKDVKPKKAMPADTIGGVMNFCANDRPDFNGCK